MTTPEPSLLTTGKTNYEDPAFLAGQIVAGVRQFLREQIATVLAFSGRSVEALAVVAKVDESIVANICDPKAPDGAMWVHYQRVLRALGVEIDFDVEPGL